MSTAQAKFGLIGRKVGMTQVYDEKGKLVPVTVVEVSENYIVDKNTKERNGYESICLAFGPVREKVVAKPQLGLFKKAGVKPCKHLREFRVDSLDGFEVGKALTAEIVPEGVLVDVQGRSIGKGFQGVMKRHGFQGGPASHGSHFHRRPGSIGMCEFPSRVKKGHKMSGHTGNRVVTTQCLRVVKVLADKGVVLIQGAIPGYNNGIVFVKHTSKPVRKRVK